MMEERSGAQYGGDVRQLILQEVWPEEGLPSLLDIGPGIHWTYGLPGVKRHIVVHDEELILTEPAIEDIQFQMLAMSPMEYIRGRAEAFVNAICIINYLSTLRLDQATYVVEQAERVAKNLVICWMGGDELIPDTFRVNWNIYYFPDWFGQELGGAILAYKIIEPLSQNIDPLAPTVDQPPWAD